MLALALTDTARTAALTVGASVAVGSGALLDATATATLCNTYREHFEGADVEKNATDTRGATIDDGTGNLVRAAKACLVFFGCVSCVAFCFIRLFDVVRACDGCSSTRTRTVSTTRQLPIRR
jgi:hypothetical protein